MSFLFVKKAYICCFMMFYCRYTSRKEACKTTQMPFYHSRKISISPKGLTHDFSQKNLNFLPICFSLKITSMMFEDVLDRKEGFLDYKNVTLP